MKINLGMEDSPHTIKINAQLAQENMNSLKELLMKYVFAWMY